MCLALMICDLFNGGDEIFVIRKYFILLPPECVALKKVTQYSFIKARRTLTVSQRKC
jgi:hypothetical protein